jgi:type I restriction enzyme S subunit
MKAEEMRADYSVLKAPETMASSWHRVRLGDIAEIVRGVTYKKEQATEGSARDTLPILRATNIQDGALVLDSDLVYVPADLVSDTQKLRVGDIVVATSSGSKHLVGKTAQVKESWEGSFGAFCAAIRPTANIEHRYLGYFFESREYKDHIAKKALGVNINNLRRGDLEEISVPIAPLDQQKRIVAEIEKQFSRLDEAVANLKRVKANLKRYKAAVLKAAVEGRLVETEAKLARCVGHSSETGTQLLERILETRRSQWQGKGKYKEPAAPDITNLPELPEGWVWASWEQVGFAQNGRPFPSKEYCDDGIKLLRPGNLHESGVLVWNVENTRHMPRSYEERNRDLFIEGGELVMNLTAQSLKDEFLGRVCMTERGERCLLNQRLARLTPVVIATKFALVVFKSKWFRRFVDGLNTGSLIQHMFTSQLATFAFPVPPLAEQHRIVAEVDRRLSLLRETEAQVDANLQRAARLRSAVLHKSFSNGI